MCFMERAISTTPAVEVWRPVKGFEGRYEVSDQGRVRSVSRWVKTAFSDRWSEGRVLKQQTLPNGYKSIQLLKDKKYHLTMVHRIVAEAFVPNPYNLPCVNHKDECKTNNSAINLEWCDKKYNTNYGTGKYRKTEGYRRPIEQLTLEGSHVAFYTSVYDAERKSSGKFSNANLARAAKTETRTAYGYRWRYVDK